MLGPKDPDCNHPGHVRLRPCVGVRFDFVASSAVVDTADAQAHLTKRTDKTIEFLTNEYGFPPPVAAWGTGGFRTILYAAEEDVTPRYVWLATLAVLHFNWAQDLYVKPEVEDEVTVNLAALETEAFKLEHGLGHLAVGLAGRLDVVTDATLKSTRAFLPIRDMVSELFPD